MKNCCTNIKIKLPHIKTTSQIVIETRSTHEPFFSSKLSFCCHARVVFFFFFFFSANDDDIDDDDDDDDDEAVLAAKSNRKKNR